MRLLIYGFGPYRKFKDNVTQKILRRLPARKGVKKVVFPVRFQKRQFIHALKRYRPDVILGLGQTSRSRRLKIEGRAVNRRRKDRAERARAIVPGGSKWLPTTLKLKRHAQAKFSRDASEYVCNYSMYVILDYLRRRRLPARFGFIHVPHTYSISSAGRFVARVVKEMERPPH